MPDSILKVETINSNKAEILPSRTLWSHPKEVQENRQIQFCVMGKPYSVALPRAGLECGVAKLYLEQVRCGPESGV